MSCSIWTEEKLYKLVQLYSKFSNLWDRDNPQYDNLRSRHTSYSKILTSLSMPTYVSVSDVLSKLKELRTIYISEIQKIEIASRAGRIWKPDHTWFEMMHEFLYDHLDADEKLAGISSSEDGTVSSEESLHHPCKKNHGYDINSGSESDSDVSSDRRNRTPVKKIRSRPKQPRKSQAYFVRSPTILRSTKMNTKYEYPGTTRASSMTVNDLSHQQGNSFVKRDHETQLCTQLDVKMTASDVSIKYLKTENVDGDEKSYEKNFKGRMLSKENPQGFKNIKMTISKSGYAVPESKDKDAEFWEIMTMLDLGIPCSLTKLESTNSPKAIPTYPGPRLKNCDGNNVVETKETPKTKSSCRCKGTELSKNREELDSASETSAKTKRVVCLGDETLFDNSLLELLQDLSIKICPVDGGCASGNCPGENPDDAFEGSLLCWTCSSATRLVKEYKIETESSSVVIEDVGRVTLNDGMEENEAPTQQQKTKSEMNLDIEKPEDDKVESEKTPARQDYDVNVALESAGVRPSSGRDAILHDAKKELWEAGKLYNSGKYITNEIVSPESKNESADFDNFGAQVAASLKMMDKQRAMKLKQKIAETLQGEKKRQAFMKH